MLCKTYVFSLLIYCLFNTILFLNGGRRDVIEFYSRGKVSLIFMHLACHLKGGSKPVCSFVFLHHVRVSVRGRSVRSITSLSGLQGYDIFCLFLCLLYSFSFDVIILLYIFSNKIASIFFPSFIYQEWISNLSGIPFVRFSPPTFSLYKPAISPNSDRMKCNICLLIHSLPTNKKYFLIADSISCPELEITGCSVPSRTYKWTFNAF